ncbi:MAG: M20/M25/M40 family metallo-hydrolase [Candidatus Aminicenantes bacterium]|nr:MAG: M20/M25/M40 family metallo-hydrolase [Candidatus Aminicenantes bacterium]
MSRFFVFVICWFCLMSIVVQGQTLTGKRLLYEVRSYRQSHEHAIIKEFFELLSIPNVSQYRENIRKNAVFIKKMMEKRGIRVQIIETPGNPVIYGELKAKDAGAAQTLLFYVHYDGQPVDPSKWIDSEPFKPVVRPGKMKAGTTTPKPMSLPPMGKRFHEDWRIYARSASDDKAPIAAILTALDAVKHAGVSLKNNLKFILDGEEEAGSPNIRYFLEKYKHLLKADVLLLCDGPGYFSGDPTLIYGARGITSISITIYGPNISLHSGHYGNWAPNPAMRLVQLLAGMKDKNGKITIKGFYDTVVPLSKREKEAIKAIPPYDDDLKKLYGFSGVESGELNLMEAILYPSLNVNGLESGWVGKQARTIVPSTATASIDIRLTKGNEPADMVQKVIDHIKLQGYHVVTNEPDQETRMKYPFIAKVITAEKGYRAARTSMDLPISKRVIHALTGYSDRKPVLIPSLGGSLPIYIFEDVLKIPFIGIPVVNYDNNQHQPNENLRIGHLWQAIETFAAVIQL